MATKACLSCRNQILDGRALIHVMAAAPTVSVTWQVDSQCLKIRDPLLSLHSFPSCPRIGQKADTGKESHFLKCHICLLNSVNTFLVSGPVIGSRN